MRPGIPACVLLVCCGPATVEVSEAPTTEAPPTSELPGDPAPLPDCEPFGISIGDRAVIDENGWVGGMEVDPPEPTTVSLHGYTLCGLWVRRGKVYADVSVDSRVNPQFAVCESDAGRVYGVRGALEPAFTPWTPPVPEGLPPSEGELTFGGREEVLTGDRVVDGAELGPGATLHVEGEVDLHVRGPMRLVGSRVEITPGSRLRVWTEGEVRLEEGSSLNLDGDPGALSLVVAGTHEVHVDSGSSLFGRVRVVDGELRVTGDEARVVGTVQALEVNVLWGGRIQVPPDLLCGE